MENNYTINKRKKRKALKIISKIEGKKTKGFFKFCYHFTTVVRVSALILGIINIVQAVRLDDYLMLIMLLVSFGFPYGLSYLPWSVYHFSVIGDYHFRCEESVTVKDNCIIYSYVDDRFEFENTRFEYIIPFDEIEKMSYCEKTMELSLDGDSFIIKEYQSGKLKVDELTSGLVLLNVFNVDLVKLLEGKVFTDSKE